MEVIIRYKNCKRLLLGLQLTCNFLMYFNIIPILTLPFLTGYQMYTVVEFS